jgi:hypothetical protein
MQQLIWSCQSIELHSRTTSLFLDQDRATELVRVRWKQATRGLVDILTRPVTIDVGILRKRQVEAQLSWRDGRVSTVN